MPGKLNLQLLRTDWDTFQESEEILKAGQPILVTDKNRFYVGDGSTKVKNLKPANIYQSDEVDIVSTDGSIFINSPNQDIDLECAGSLTLKTTDSSQLALLSKGEVYLESGYNSGGDGSWFQLNGGDIDASADGHIELSASDHIKLSSDDEIIIDANSTVDIGCDDSININARLSNINLNANSNVLIKADYNNSTHTYNSFIGVGSTGIEITSSDNLDIDTPTINIVQNSITASNPTLHIGNHSLKLTAAGTQLKIEDLYSSSRMQLIAGFSIQAIYNNAPSLDYDIIRYKDIIGNSHLKVTEAVQADAAVESLQIKEYTTSDPYYIYITDTNPGSFSNGIIYFITE